MKRLIGLISLSRSLAAAAAVILPAAALASSTGLNNIPTADTPGDREGVFQWFSTFPTEGKADHWLGSAGFLYHFHTKVALASWVSQPTDHGPTSFTIKLNLIFRY
jgi:hypothetical protein